MGREDGEVPQDPARALGPRLSRECPPPSQVAALARQQGHEWRLGSGFRARGRRGGEAALPGGLQSRRVLRGATFGWVGRGPWGPGGPVVGEAVGRWGPASVLHTRSRAAASAQDEQARVKLHACHKRFHLQTAKVFLCQRRARSGFLARFAFWKVEGVTYRQLVRCYRGHGPPQVLDLWR